MSGLRGGTIEPFVPLLTFIGSIELDKKIENQANNKADWSEDHLKYSTTDNQQPPQESPQKQKRNRLGK